MVKIAAVENGRTIYPDYTGINETYTQLAYMTVDGSSPASLTSGAYRVAPISHILHDTGPNLIEVGGTRVTDNVVNNNTIPLRAGTYRFEIRIIAQEVGDMKTRLINQSTSIEIPGLALGYTTANEYAHHSYIGGFFTIGSDDEFTIEARVSSNGNWGSDGGTVMQGDIPRVWIMAEFFRQEIIVTGRIVSVDNGRQDYVPNPAQIEYAKIVRQFGINCHGGTYIGVQDKTIGFTDVIHDDSSILTLGADSNLGLPTPTAADPDTFSDLLFWLKAEDITGLSDQDPVVTWEDSHSNNHDASAVNGPLWNNPGTGGFDSVQFNGTNQGFEISSLISVMQFTMDFTIFFVIQTEQDIADLRQCLFAATDSGDSNSYFILELSPGSDGITTQRDDVTNFNIQNREGGNRIITDGYGTGNNTLNSTADYNEGIILVAFRFGSSADFAGHRSVIYQGLNKVWGCNEAAAASPVTNLDRTDIGKARISSTDSRFFKGEIFEVWSFNRQLSDQELANNLQYAINKYSIKTPDSELQPDDASISGSLVAWWDAGAGVTTSGGKVTSWLDQSSNSIDMAQAVDSKRPVVTSDAINGQPAITFDETDLGGLDNTADIATFQSISNCNAFFVVRSSTSSETINTIMRASDDAKADHDWGWISNSKSTLGGQTSPEGIYARANGTGIFDTSSDSVMKRGRQGPFRLIRTINSTTDITINAASKVFVHSPDDTLHSSVENEVLANSGCFDQVTGLNGIRIGYAKNSVGDKDFFNGDIAEIIIYDSVLSFFQMKQIENYLNNKYGLFDVKDAFTLQAGTYRCQIYCVMNDSERANARLYDVTSGQDLLYSETIYNPDTSLAVPLFIQGTFTLSQASDLVLIVQGQDTQSDDGLGRSSTYDVDEKNVYAQAEFWRTSE